MSISKIYSPDLYNGDGVENTFPITFDYLNTNTNIKVTTITDDVETIKVNPTHYTILNNQVILNTDEIPDIGTQVRIEFSPDYLQEEDFKSNQRFPSTDWLQAIDKLTLTLQQLQYTLDNSVVDPLTGTSNNIIGTISVQNANNVSISGGDIVGITDLEEADGGTGASNASNARANLGLTIGTNVQAYSSVLANTTASFTTAQETIISNLGTLSTQDSDNVSITDGTINAETIDIPSLDEDMSPDLPNDYTFIYDDSDSINKKVKLNTAYQPPVIVNNDTSPSLGGDLDTNGFDIIFPSVTISDISNDPTLAGASQTEGLTEYAAKTYVDTAFSSNTVLVPPSVISFCWANGFIGNRSTVDQYPCNIVYGDTNSLGDQLDPTTGLYTNAGFTDRRTPYVIPMDGDISNFYVRGTAYRTNANPVPSYLLSFAVLRPMIGTIGSVQDVYIPDLTLSSAIYTGTDTSTTISCLKGDLLYIAWQLQLGPGLEAVVDGFSWACIFTPTITV